MQRRKVKTSLGKEFSPNSLSRLLSNKRYIGVYIYNRTEKPGGMPRILDDDLFYRVQDIMNKNKNAPARTHGENEYLLTTKLFCGYCKEMMTGYGGTGKSGRAYHCCGYQPCLRRRVFRRRRDHVPCGGHAARPVRRLSPLCFSVGWQLCTHCGEWQISCRSL